MTAVTVLVVFVLLCIGFVILRKRSLAKQAKLRKLQLLRCTPEKTGFKATGKSYLVTGGHGFLGSHVVEALLARGEKKIFVYDQANSTLFAEEKYVTFIKGDLLDTLQLTKACEGKDTVFHTAAMVDYWSRASYAYPKIHAVNVTGTENVIDACKKSRVRQLIHVSSGSVVLPHDLDRQNFNRITEAKKRYPEGNIYLNNYVHTKILAEKAVLHAATKDPQDHEGLLVSAIRPGGIFGPRDAALNRIFIEADPAVQGIGLAGNVGCDYNYVENVVHALFCVENSLQSPTSPCNGKAYFIAEDENPAPTYYDWNIRLAKKFGIKFELLPNKLVHTLALIIESLLNLTHGRIGPILGDIGTLTGPTVTLARALWTVDDSLARKEIGWKPLYNTERGLDLCAAYGARVKQVTKEYLKTGKIPTIAATQKQD